MKKIRFYLLTTMALTLSALASAQVLRDSVVVYFAQGKSAFDPFYEGNARRLMEFTNKAKSLQRSADLVLDRVVVVARASPEGSLEVNERLAYNRAQNIAAYLHQNIRFDENAFEVSFKDMDWALFERLVREDPYVPKRRELLPLIEDRDLTRIKVVRFQHTWDYLLENIFPEMRTTVVYFEYKGAPAEPEPVVVTPPEPEKEPETEVRPPVVLPPPMPDDEEDFFIPEIVERRPWSMYIKTNFLPWALLDANLALEFEMGRHASLSIPFYYSAADWFRPRNKFRVIGTQPELRLWFRDNFSGPFFALHGTAGYYNIALETKEFRIQDRDGRTPAYGGGLNFGWKFRLDPKGADRWGLELSVGAGYLRLDYDLFYNVENGRYSTSKVQDYFGPDHAALTLTYRIGR